MNLDGPRASLVFGGPLPVSRPAKIERVTPPAITKLVDARSGAHPVGVDRCGNHVVGGEGEHADRARIRRLDDGQTGGWEEWPDAAAVSRAARSDREAKGPQLLAAILGDLLRAPGRHPDPVDPE